MYWDALIQNKQKRREEQGPLLLNKYLVSLVCGLAGKTCCISKGWNDYINLNVSSVTSLQLLPCLPANTKTNRWAGAQPGSQERSPWGEECSHHNFYFSFFLFSFSLLSCLDWSAGKPPGVGELMHSASDPVLWLLTSLLVTQTWPAVLGWPW